jgi:hypothetical protein
VGADNRLETDRRMVCAHSFVKLISVKNCYLRGLGSNLRIACCFLEKNESESKKNRFGLHRLEA